MNFLFITSHPIYIGNLDLEHRTGKVKNAGRGEGAHFKEPYITEFLLYASGVSSYVFLMSDSSTYAMYFCMQVSSI